MITTIIISLIAILFAWFARFSKFKYGLEASFVCLTIFMSLRYNFGNDYPAYLEMFKDINFYTFSDAINANIEVGWYILNRLFKPIGFFGLIIVLTVFEYFVIYKLVKRYVPVKWYWFSIFIFTFSTNLMLVGVSMMRQFLSICIFLIAIDFILKKKIIISLLLVLLASTFHTSALILIPFCFIGYLEIPLSKYKYIWFGIYIFLYFFAVLIFDDMFFKLLKLEYFQDYEVYLYDEQGEKGTGLGTIFYMIMFFLILANQKYQNQDMKIIYVLFLFSFFFSFFGEIAPLITRLGFYFSILSIVCYPTMFAVLKNKLVKIPILLAYLFITIYGYYNFFYSEVWHDAFINYQTIFTIPTWI